MNTKIIEKRQKMDKIYDEIDKSYIENNDFIKIFQREENLIKEVNNVKKKGRYLDYLFLEYETIKKNINDEINNNIKKLSAINKYTDEILNDSYKQNSYLYQEYKLLITVTNTKEYLKIINDFKFKINILMQNIEDDLILKYMETTNKNFKNIFIFVNAEKSAQKVNKLPNFREFVNNKKKFIEEIGNLLYKKKLFDQYIHSLEDLYTTIVEYKLKR